MKQSATPVLFGIQTGAYKRCTVAHSTLNKFNVLLAMACHLIALISMSGSIFLVAAFANKHTNVFVDAAVYS